MITLSADLRPQFRPVQHQGARPSCLAFAATSTHERHAAIADPLCVEYLFYKAIGRSGSGANGCTMDAMKVTLATDGQPLESYWPYLPVQPPLPAWIPPSGIGQVWKTNSDAAPALFADTVGLIRGGTPVVLGLIITERFMRCDPAGRLPAISPDAEKGGHAVVALGYGEDNSGEPYLLIRNSWGSGWGLGGHAFLDRKYLDAQLKEAMILK